MPDVDQIRQLVDMMVTNDLVELNVRDGDLEIKLKRPTAPTAEMIAMPAPNPGAVSLPVPPPAATPAAPVAAATEEDTALALGVSRSTVTLAWRAARAWLGVRLEDVEGRG